jgi:rare lipoprotein A
MRSAALLLIVGAPACAAGPTAAPVPASAAPAKVAEQTEACAGAPPYAQVGLATYYARSLEGRRTANGERYDPKLLTAAHRTLPFGTRAMVRRKDGRSVVVRINDRGPFGRGRVIDLSERAAAAIGLLRDGIAEVEIRVLSGADP